VKSYNAYLGVPGTQEDPWESEVSPKCHRIEDGAVMTLFPGVWHRHAPDPKTGWVEQWIECCGPAFDRARNAGLLRPERPVWRVGLPPELLQAFEHCHALVQQRSAGFQALLSTMGLHLLSVLLRAAQRHSGAPRPMDHKIQQAQGFDSAFHLSKQFKESTGMAPQTWRRTLNGLRAKRDTSLLSG
jgi:hypothetical protein